jgi:glycyl-tRNA synthetase
VDARAREPHAVHEDRRSTAVIAGVLMWIRYGSVTDVTMDQIVSLCRRRGFVFPSSEIYGGLSSTYDYGHYGVLMKNEIRQAWLRAMVQERDDIVALDSAVILNPAVWEASGHVAGFTDPLVDCRTCKLRFRADKLEDSQCGKRPSKRPGEDAQCDLTEARQFNLMFQTQVGALEGASSTAFLRPETAQGIFINFKNVLQLARRKPPFGIAQTGKSFRNEITPGNFLFRVREFEQMEMEFFVPPADAPKWHEYWIEQRVNWHLGLGLRREMVRVRPHEAAELSHYSSATSDIEYLYPIGWQELEGVANRGDYDLTQHTQSSGTKLEFVGQDGERYVPYVIEPAVSIERIFVALLCDAYHEEVVGERERTVLRLSPRVAPVKAAVLPLISKDAGMATHARNLFEELRKRFSVEHDDSGQIGRRYRRQDEIGTPWAFTIDEQTLEDETVTVRDRDSLAQERIPISGVASWLSAALEQPWSPPAAA